MRLTQLRQRLRDHGALPCHEHRVLRLWSQAMPQDSGRRKPEDFLPLSVRTALPALEADLHGLARLISEHPAEDGSARLLVGLHDGQTVESVLLPRDGLCVSTQVGCAVGCRFCASGLFGVERNLSTDEIVEQIVHARRVMRIDRIVFMGMGEPSHNLENVLAAVARIKDEVLISPRRQTLSTIGGVKVFERMGRAEVRPCLAVSLHLACDERRRELLPRAHKDPLVEMVAAADAYGRANGIPVQFEWTLLAGVNDSDADVEQLCTLLKGVRGYVNFIVYNPVDGLPFAAPCRERIIEIVRAVKARGILATIRDSSGPDAQAACGQLRLRDRGAAGAPSTAP